MKKVRTKSEQSSLGGKMGHKGGNEWMHLCKGMQEDGLSTDASIGKQALFSEFNLCVRLVQLSGHFKNEMVHATGLRPK